MARIQTGHVDPRFRHQRRQPGNEVEGFDKIAGSDFEQPNAGPKGGGQDARSNMTSVVPSRYGVFSWVAPAHPCARDTCDSLHVVSDVAVRRERQALFRDGRPADVATQPLELLALIRPRRHAGVQGESGDLTDPVIEGLVTSRQRLQREHFATLLRPDGDAVGDRRTQRNRSEPSGCSTYTPSRNNI